MVRQLAIWVGSLTLILFGSNARAADTPDPARFIPDRAELLIRIDDPRDLVESFTELDLLQELYAFGPINEQLTNTPEVRRFFQLLKYFEQELGDPWPKLLDRLAGGGIAIGVKVTPGDPQVVAVIQGTDEALTKKFLALVTDLVESELARTESPAKFDRGEYRGIPGYRLGDLRVAQVGSAIVMASTQDAGKAALDLHLEREAGVKVSSMAEAQGPKEARKLLPNGKALFWAYANYGAYKSTPAFKEVLDTPRNNFLATVLFAGWLDVAARSDYGTLGLFRDANAFRLAVRFPAKRDGLPEELAIHVPRTGKGGTLPLLRPKGTILSHSFYFDADAFYQHRNKLLTPENVEQLDDAIKQGSKITPFASIPELLKYSGVYHRVVVARPIEAGYTKKPLQPIPSIAFVSKMRDKRFARNAEPLLRGAALLASTQIGLKMTEEKYQDVKIVSYRFSEDKELDGDTENIRFAFVPCFATVDDQFILCTNAELCKELIDLIREAGDEEPEPENMRSRIYADGARAYLKTIPEQLVTQAVLDQAIPIEVAQEQIQELFNMLGKAGTLTFETEHGNNHFDFNITWKLKSED